MLNTLTIKKVCDLAMLLQQDRGLDELIETSLSQLENLFSAEQSVILNWVDFNWGGRALSKDDMFFHNHENSHDWNYPATHQEDPLYDWIISGCCHNDFNVTRLSDLISFNQLKKTEFFTRLLLPMNCRFVLTMAIHHRGEILASISMIRPPSQRNFTRSDVQLAQLIVPVLASAYANVLLHSKNQQQDDIFNIVCQQQEEQALIVFSDKLKSVYRTPKMTRLGKRLKRYGNSINDIFRRSAKLEKYLTLFMSGNTAQQKRMPRRIVETVRLNDELSLWVSLELSCHNRQQPYLVGKVDIQTGAGHVHDIQIEYGLSFREFQVLQLAATGQSSAEIGKALAISAWSVKNHLKNIYKKTGVNSRAALAQFV